MPPGQTPGGWHGLPFDEREIFQMFSARIRDGQSGRNCEREFALYDGQDLLGRVISRNGSFEAFDPTGKTVGALADQAAAITALRGDR